MKFTITDWADTPIKCDVPCEISEIITVVESTAYGDTVVDIETKTESYNFDSNARIFPDIDYIVSITDKEEIQQWFDEHTYVYVYTRPGRGADLTVLDHPAPDLWDDLAGEPVFTLVYQGFLTVNHIIYGLDCNKEYAQEIYEDILAKIKQANKEDE